MNLRRFAPGPVPRLALGVVALLVFLLMMLEIVIGVMPDRHQDAVKTRSRVAEALAVQIAALLQHDSLQAMTATLLDVLERDPELQSIAVRHADGELVVTVGPHASNWSLPDAAPSTLTDVRVPLKDRGQLWGHVELTFTPVDPETLAGWLRDPVVRAMLLFSVLGVALVYLYLRRALQYLDPSGAVPQRVRAAFDTVRDAVLLLDAQHRVVLVNSAFARVHPQAGGITVGKSIEGVHWLMPAFGPDNAQWPWRTAAQTRMPIAERLIELSRHDLPGDVRRLLINAAPLLDADNRYRGCILSLSDVTALHRSNTELRQTIEALDESNARIREQNEELTRLATRDPLTGCLNRRAFYERLPAIIAGVKRSGQPAGCIMLDIDHFKRFNDTYGHAVGDLVLCAVARELTRGIREEDLLCRFGGEEFCVVLPGQGLAETAAVAERLREAIEQQAGADVPAGEPVRVTSSFGVAQLTAEHLDGEQLVIRADAALYLAKGAGRNRVMTELDLPAD